MSVFSKIRTKYNTLSPAQKRVADYVLQNQDKIAMLTISSLAKKCDTSETTIFRFLKKLDYESYQVFRVKAAQEISEEKPEAIYEEINKDDSISAIKQKVIMSTSSAIKDLYNLVDDDSLAETINLIKKADRVLFYGVGASHAIAMDAYHKFARLGINAVNIRDAHMMNILSTHTDTNDLLFVISHSGESIEVLEPVKLAKENDVKVIGITSYENSTLSNLVDIQLLSSTNETKYRSDAMVSRIIQLVIIDILYVSFVTTSEDEYIDKVNKSRLAVAQRKT
ncbi:MAG: MurR/RpiR family transcriptional regulator [Bacillota bacterium]